MAEILTDHGAACCRKGIGDYGGDGAELIADAGDRRGNDAVAVDKGIDEQHGEVDGGGLQDHGEAQLGKLGQHLTVRTEALEPEIKAEGFLVLIEIKDRPEEAYGLSNNRGKGGALRAEAKAGDEDQIQHQIHNGSHGNKHQRMLGVAHAPENGGHQIVAIDKHQTKNTHKAVVTGQVKAFLRSVHQMQKIVEKNAAKHAQQDRHQERDSEHSTDGAFDPVMLPCTDVLGEDYLTGIGKAHDQKREEMQHVAANGDSGKTVFSNKLTDNHHIDHVIKGLQQIGT